MRCRVALKIGRFHSVAVYLVVKIVLGMVSDKFQIQHSTVKVSNVLYLLNR